MERLKRDRCRSLEGRVFEDGVRNRVDGEGFESFNGGNGGV